MKGLLVANRGEIAIRVMRAAAELSVRSVAVHSEDDATCLHTRCADEVRALRGVGPAAYLDAEQLVSVAREAGCDAIHPGYGFLSESAAFARRCAEAGLRFVGPSPESLALFGDKGRALRHAEACGVPRLPGTGPLKDGEGARQFLAAETGPIVLKAVAGGGGRGLRVVHTAGEIEAALERCRSEALAAFGSDAVYAERYLPRVRHVEVQVVGDGSGAVCHLWERECSLQRQRQKLVEIAPSAGLPETLRDQLLAAAVRMAEAARLESLATFEFLVAEGTPSDVPSPAQQADFFFIEANPRLQVEHTVTEEITGIDLVQTQLQLASGSSLAELGLVQEVIPRPRGFALQARINMETMQADGSARPAGGTLHSFEVPSGPGLRTDTFGYVGYETSPRFDPLLAKLVARTPGPDFEAVVRRAQHALCSFRIEGVATNLPFLRSLLADPAVQANRVSTDFVAEHAETLLGAAQRTYYFETTLDDVARGLAGAQIDASDPLAVLEHGHRRGRTAFTSPVAPLPEGVLAVRAPLQGTVVSVDVREGERVRPGQILLVLEAMKMEHVIAAPAAGVVRHLVVSPGDAVFESHELLHLEEALLEAPQERSEEAVDPSRVRPDLQEVHERHAVGLDEARPEAVARRRKTGQSTARENLAALCDPGSFIEYGPLVIAAQRRRRSLEDLISRTPADGMVAGIGTVNASLFPEAEARCILISYDYTVLAGTQGQQNHRKKDRMFELAEKWRLPVVFFTEGGGGRPGDTDGLGVAGLDCRAFHLFGGLSGLVPLVGINSGRCFAGNAVLLGCCDVVIAAQDSNIGMGGPAMIEGGGLGIFRPEEVGPMADQVPNGVVDVAVADETEAAAVARQYLSYFQGRLSEWQCADQRLLRNAIPENRLRVYDVRRVIETLADSDSVLELRRGFGQGMLTVLARIEGRPVGIVANNPMHLAGAIDREGADKAARFMQLCDAFDIPLVFLCDTPGIMVGPESERTALVRHASRMFVVGASLTVPFMTIVLRKGYGLGAQAMAGGSFHAPLFTLAWPTGEFGGMGLEGAVKLGYRKELAAEQDPARRKALFEEMVARMYKHGKAVNTASHFEIDDVIDPMDSRSWILRALTSVPPPPPRSGKKRPCIDTW